MNEKVSQISTGIRAFLKWPLAYNIFQRLVGANKLQKIFIQNYLENLKEDVSLIDIGCGDAAILSLLPKNMSYVGFDENEKYINFAKNKYGDRGIFFSMKISQAEKEVSEKFDFAIALGVIHHLNNDEALELFQLASNKLKEGGSLFTIDPVYTKDQSKISKFIISKDRGQFVRDSDGYQELARKVFKQVGGLVRTDLVTIPYTHWIMNCKK